MKTLLKEIRHNPLLWLLAFVPVVFAAQKLKPEAHTLIFVLSVLAIVPLAPGIKASSIIAIKGDDQPPDGADGVVKHTGTHVDYAEAEFIVRSGHSCQMNPLTIEEVRRTLLENLGETKP
ncbi:MAG: hypothetical protein PHY43_13620 [Verrucomicrobiales bacterium]|nr:hypothetical protein [Verrucomicrobiales bacterium]